MTHNGSLGIDWNQLTTRYGFLEFDSNRLITQNASRILIHISSRLKRLSKILIQIVPLLKKLFGILIEINLWLNCTLDSIPIGIPTYVYIRFIFDFVWSFGAISTSVDLAWLFLGLWLKCWLVMTFFGISTQVPSRKNDSDQLMTQPVSRRLELIQLRTQEAF